MNFTMNGKQIKLCLLADRVNGMPYLPPVTYHFSTEKLPAKVVQGTPTLNNIVKPQFTEVSFTFSMSNLLSKNKAVIKTYAQAAKSPKNCEMAYEADGWPKSK